MVKQAKAPVGRPNHTCSECGTGTTPLWRRGPEGKSTLCNACGTRWARSHRRDKKKAVRRVVAKKTTRATTRSASRAAHSPGVGRRTTRRVSKSQEEAAKIVANVSSSAAAAGHTAPSGMLEVSKRAGGDPEGGSYGPPMVYPAGVYRGVVGVSGGQSSGAGSSSGGWNSTRRDKAGTLEELGRPRHTGAVLGRQNMAFTADHQGLGPHLSTPIPGGALPDEITVSTAAGIVGNYLSTKATGGMGRLNVHSNDPNSQGRSLPTATRPTFATIAPQVPQKGLQFPPSLSAGGHPRFAGDPPPAPSIRMAPSMYVTQEMLKEEEDDVGSSIANFARDGIPIDDVVGLTEPSLGVSITDTPSYAPLADDQYLADAVSSETAEATQERAQQLLKLRVDLGLRDERIRRLQSEIRAREAECQDVVNLVGAMTAQLAAARRDIHAMKVRAAEERSQVKRYNQEREALWGEVIGLKERLAKSTQAQERVYNILASFLTPQQAASVSSHADNLAGPPPLEPMNGVAGGSDFRASVTPEQAKGGQVQEFSPGSVATPSPTLQQQESSPPVTGVTPSFSLHEGGGSSPASASVPVWVEPMNVEMPALPGDLELGTLADPQPLRLPVTEDITSLLDGSISPVMGNGGRFLSSVGNDSIEDIRVLPPLFLS